MEIFILCILVLIMVGGFLWHIFSYSDKDEVKRGFETISDRLPERKYADDNADDTELDTSNSVVLIESPPIEASILSVVGWLVSLLSILYFVMTVVFMEQDFLAGFILCLSAIIGSLVLVGFAKIISLLWEINKKTLDPHNH